MTTCLLAVLVTIILMLAEGTPNKINFEESLRVYVINTGKCVGCGACIISCPLRSIEFKDGLPTLVKECTNCGTCARVCPSYNQPRIELDDRAFSEEGNVDHEFGAFCRLSVAQTTDDKVRELSQNGGVVTALLLFALRTDLIDAAVVSGVIEEKPFLPNPRLATTSEEILKCAGTRYFYSPNILALEDASTQKKTDLAFVGTPCQIRALRKAQKAGLKFFTSVKYLIGLMCSECFVYEKLMEGHLHEALGLKLNLIRNMNIKGKMLVATDSGIHSVPLAEIKRYSRDACRYCSDFSSELADMSVGGLGMDGWSFVIIRTRRGSELFEGAERTGAIRTRNVKEEPNAIKLLCRLSKKKKQISVS